MTSHGCDLFLRCTACLVGVVQELPTYIEHTLAQYYEGLKTCRGRVYYNSNAEADTDDSHCKTSKFKHLANLAQSIRTRSEAWLAYVKEDPGVRGLQSLFSQEELD